RLMDPLAELVKIDPKSIGVGQYQHDVDQTKLKNHSTRQWRTVECQKQQRDLLSKSGYSLSFAPLFCKRMTFGWFPRGNSLGSIHHCFRSLPSKQCH
ncbi:hypothetical protein ACIXWV_20640, partial [Bacteroides fragilis]